MIVVAVLLLSALAVFVVGISIGIVLRHEAEGRPDVFARR